MVFISIYYEGIFVRITMEYLNFKIGELRDPVVQHCLCSRGRNWDPKTLTDLLIKYMLATLGQNHKVYAHVKHCFLIWSENEKLKRILRVLVKYEHNLQSILMWQLCSCRFTFASYSCSEIPTLNLTASFQVTLNPWWLRWQRICQQYWRPGFDPWVGKIPWKREWQPTPVLPGEFHGQRSLASYCPWGCKE